MKAAIVQHHDLTTKIDTLKAQLMTLNAERKAIEAGMVHAMRQKNVYEIESPDTQTGYACVERTSRSLSLKWVKTVLLELLDNKEFSVLTTEEKLEAILESRPEKKAYVLKCFPL